MEIDEVATPKVIENYSAKSLRPIFDLHISIQAHILDDGCTGYKPLVQETILLRSKSYLESGETFLCYTTKSGTLKTACSVYVHTTMQRIWQTTSTNIFSALTGGITENQYFSGLLKECLA